MKLFSLFGVAAAAAQAPKILQGQLVFSAENDFTKISYKIHDSIQPNIRTIYKVDNFTALKKSYADAGLLIDTTATRFPDFTKTTLTFNCPASRRKFLKEYNDNISSYRNA